MKIIIYISLSFLFISCEEINQNKNYKSIYDFNSNQITGNNEPVRISITEKGETVYKIKCDSLITFEENILLFDNVDIEISKAVEFFLINRSWKSKNKIHHYRAEKHSGDISWTFG